MHMLYKGHNQAFLKSWPRFHHNPNIEMKLHYYLNSRIFNKNEHFWNKLIKEKTIIHYQRYADDVLCICLKNSVDTILNKMNSWDGKLSFTVENLVNNVINFLDARIFIENRQIKFRKVFKKAEKTVFTNFKLSISPYKY